MAQIVLSALEFTLVDADFENGTILVERNLTVVGDPALPDYPILRLLANKKVRLSPWAGQGQPHGLPRVNVPRVHMALGL